MEHACHRCGSAVPDSSPFCSECGAPQVRFSRAELTEDGVTVPSRPEPPALAVLTPEQVPTDLEASRRIQGRERGVAIRAALKGAAIAVLLCLFPVGRAIALPLGGFLAVLFYRGQSWRANSSKRSGFRLGALAGLFAFLVFAALMLFELSTPSGRVEAHKAVVDNLHTLEAGYSDPEQRQRVEDWMRPERMPILYLLSTLFLAALFVVLSGVGGAIAAALLRRRGPPV